VVETARGAIPMAARSSWDLAVDGSPTCLQGGGQKNGRGRETGRWRHESMKVRAIAMVLSMGLKNGKKRSAFLISPPSLLSHGVVLRLYHKDVEVSAQMCAVVQVLLAAAEQLQHQSFLDAFLAVDSGRE